jgi:pyruvate kinase
MLIASLPPVYREELLQEIISHPSVDAVRYNTGVLSPYDPFDTLSRIQLLAEPLKKPIYVDLKAKQLRITEWSSPPYGPIVLNHNIEVELPAKVYFRGTDYAELREVRDNVIFVDPPPRVVGNGQSINILAKNLKIEGGLLRLDYQYIRAALLLGINKFMLSFVESADDVRELEGTIETYAGVDSDRISDLEIVFKIESTLGMDYVRKGLSKRNFADGSPYRLMAARDDLQIHIGEEQMLDACKDIIAKDANAIVASRLLAGLDKDDDSGEVTGEDVYDLERMFQLGYRRFMLSDGICQYHSKKALAFWEQYWK